MVVSVVMSVAELVLLSMVLLSTEVLSVVASLAWSLFPQEDSAKAAARMKAVPQFDLFFFPGCVKV